MFSLRAAFHTLGCKTNHYETDAARRQFSRAGFQVVPFDSFAEVYLVNTCTVTGEAGRKSRQMLRRARKVNPQAVVVALGCHAELADLDCADIIIGNSGKSLALEQVCRVLQTRGIDLPELHLVPAAAGDLDVYEEFGPVDQQTETRAYVKIEDGCDNFCSYCAIPFARGRVRSRNSGNVLAEAAALAAAGYREIILTGIHVCSYGSEQGRPSHAVMELTRDLAAIKGLERIRLGSLEPQSLSPQFLELAHSIPKLLPHFHLSLQSGSDSVLSRMNRRYTTADYRDVVSRLRQTYDRPGLTTDVIVGFPGETEAEHEASLAFCREIGFSRLHVFRYSKRAGTAAAEMSGQIDPQISARRSHEMMLLAEQMALDFHRSQIGQPQQVLLEKPRPDGLFEGYSPQYVPIRTPAQPGFAEGQIVTLIGIAAEAEFLFCR